MGLKTGYIAGTKFKINNKFPELPYQILKQSLIRMKDRKFYVQECVICFESIKNDSLCRMLSCFHIFHSRCIDQWLENNASCPMCQKVLKTREQCKVHLKENQMNAISVDNECFYSDHIIIRKPHILTSKELKYCFLYALPHEFRPFRNKKNDLIKV
jgi:hypothetical protein